MRLRERMLSVLLAASAAFTAAVPVYAENEGNKEFDEFMKQEFIETMEGDYLSLHFALVNPSAYGIEVPEAVISSTPADDYQTAIDEANASLKKLSAFDYASLSDTQKHDYDVYKRALELSVEMNGYENFDWAFNSGNSITDIIITNLTEFVFREEQDFEDYLNLIASVPGYMDEVMELTKSQAEEGYFIRDSALDETLDSIDKFTAKKDSNELIVLFDHNTDAFEGLSDEKKEEFKEENRRIILEELIPSFERCADGLEALRGSRANQGSLYDLEGGLDYYKALVRTKTSSDESIEELIKLADTYLNQNLKKYINLLMYSNISEDEEVPFDNETEILDYLAENLQEYPEIPKVSYQAKYLDPSVANDSILAYYLNPPIDDMEENQIKINGTTVGEDLTKLYSTLAHEGMPGHMYQTNYYLDTQPAELRTQLSCIGYSEGWAMYAEINALDYSQMMSEVIKLEKLDTAINYVLDAVADLYVNGLGYTEEKVGDYLENMGLNRELASPLYDFVANNPGMLLPYGIGLMEFQNLRAKAEAALGTDFDTVEFHKVVLDNGDRQFELVKNDVAEWIESKGGNSAIEPETEPVPAPAGQISIWVYAAGAGIVIVGLIAAILALRSRRRNTF